jgi:hypothetical protein
VPCSDPASPPQPGGATSFFAGIGDTLASGLDITACFWLMAGCPLAAVTGTLPSQLYTKAMNSLGVDTASNSTYPAGQVAASVLMLGMGGLGDLAGPADTAAKEVEALAQEIIQSTARAQAARGVDALRGALSPAERAAMDADPGLTNRMLGQAVHRLTAAALDEAYPGRFLYFTRGPDFVDTETGEKLELTTPGEVASHRARPGYDAVTMCVYILPTPC